MDAGSGPGMTTVVEKGTVPFEKGTVPFYDTAECVLSQSFSAASTRVCQPSPVARKAWITSFDRRMVVDTFVGDFCGPRARMPKVFAD